MKKYIAIYYDSFGFIQELELIAFDLPHAKYLAVRLKPYRKSRFIVRLFKKKA